MEYCNILSQGDKIKLLRRKYRLKQEDIAGKDVTRNLISEIETNKANLSRSTAEIILKNLNRIAEEQNFAVNETLEYLLETETVQAEKVLDKYINELKNVMIYKDNTFLNTLKEVEEFLVRWDIKDKKIIIYELAGDYFCNQNEMYKSVVYYEKALTLVGKYSISEGLLSLLRKLSMVYEYVEKYNESIDCCNLALTHFSDLSNDYKFIFLYNSALSYQKLGNFQKALDNLNKSESIVDRSNVSRVFKILDDKAVCLKKLGYYDEAIRMYNEILEFLNDSDIDKKLIVYINIINFYIKLNNTDKVNHKFKFVTDNLGGVNDSQYIDDIYFEVGLIYEYLDDFQKSEKHYLKALEFSKREKNYSLVRRILDKIIDLYIVLNDKAKMEEMIKEVFQLSNKQERLNNKLMYKLIDFYASNDDVKTIKEINKFALQFE